MVVTFDKRFIFHVSVRRFILEEDRPKFDIKALKFTEQEYDAYSID